MDAALLVGVINIAIVVGMIVLIVFFAKRK
jgi:hypothetical protein